jgi:AcrR family transcriptional regulator
MNRPRTREQPAVRRAMILDEGIRALGEHGFNGVTVQALARRCGISNAGLLYYFGSKDEILIAVLGEIERRETEVMSPLVASVAPRANTAAPSRAAVVDLLRTMASRFMMKAAQTRFALVLQAESLDPSHPAHAWFSERERMTLDLFAALVAHLVPAPMSTSRQLLGLLQGLGIQWLRADLRFDLLEEWDRGVAVLLPEPTAWT